MANTPKKITDPTEAALSAIQGEQSINPKSIPEAARERLRPIAGRYF